MKKTLITALTIGIACSSLSVFAGAKDDVLIPNTPTVTSVFHVEERNDDNSEKYGYGRENTNVSTTTILARIKSNGDRLILERLNSLNANRQAIDANKSLTIDQKAALMTLITNNITGLTALRMSISVGTDITSVKNLVASIYTNFRIYGIVIPQIRLEKRIYDLQNYSIKLSDTFIKVQAKIDEHRGKGKDVTVWQKNLDDSKVLVANDMNTLTNLLTTVVALKPIAYGTTSKATIELVNNTLKSVLKDFNSIKKNLHRPALLTNRKVVGMKNASTSPLFETKWVWTSMIQSGVTKQAPTGEKFVLSFGEDNRVRSTTDCNGIKGSYALGNNGMITFGSFISTVMSCEGSQEQDYSRALTGTTAYKIEGATLTLTNATGTMLFTRK